MKNKKIIYSTTSWNFPYAHSVSSIKIWSHFSKVTLQLTQSRSVDLVNLHLYFFLFRVLDHPNLCKFIGATVKNPRNLCIISEYCPKGSLNDVLLNDDIPLNWGFRFSFASDTARGMSYLHSKKVAHGRLTSSNCIIDDRWVLKISGMYSEIVVPIMLRFHWLHTKRIQVSSDSAYQY